MGAGGAIRRLAAVLAAAATVLTLAQTPATAAGSALPCTADTGPYQRELERYLGLPEDGRQSPADCVAISDFQAAHGVRPEDGYAGPATYRTMLVVAAAPDPNAAGKCPRLPGLTTCVDLDRQLLWVQGGSGGEVVFGPVPVRTGKDGSETRTGMHYIFERSLHHVSTIYEGASMPFSQFFDGGQALHGTFSDLYEGGSGGCVNLRLPDAARLWALLDTGDRVYVWGRKPST